MPILGRIVTSNFMSGAIGFRGGEVEKLFKKIELWLLNESSLGPNKQSLVQQLKFIY